MFDSGKTRPVQATDVGIYKIDALYPRGRKIKSIGNLVSHCLPCNSIHNVLNHAIGIMEAFSNVNIVAKLLAKLQEFESSCRCTYNGVGGVIM